MKQHRTAIIAVWLIAVLSACGACGAAQTPEEKQLFVAETLEDMAKEARSAVLEMHMDRMRNAADRARLAGQDARQAARDADEQFRSEPWLHGVNVFISAKRSYIDVLVLLQAESEEGPRALLSAEAKRLLRNTLSAYDSLRLALGEAGKDLPPVPGLLRAVL